MNIINGKIYGDNVTIVNGRVINRDDDSAYKKFDEIKKVSAREINNITINSNVNVKISASETNEVTAHLHGSAIMNSELKFSVIKLGDKIQVCVETEGNLNSSSSMTTISIGTIFFKNTVVMNNGGIISGEGLVLDIKIPVKAFKKICVESRDGNIDIAASVNADTILIESENGNVDVSASLNALTIENKNGSVDVSASLNALTIECKNGNIDVDLDVNSNVTLNVNSKNGNVDVAIGNIRTCNVWIDSKNGKCKNNPKLRGQYTVSGYVTSKNGNVKFH